MANYHLTVKAISRNGGRSCVAALAYRTASMLVDFRTGEKYDYINKDNVEYVEICVLNNFPNWIKSISEECKTSRETALQKLSDILEKIEKRPDARVYREIEFSLPRELNHEQNIAWARQFVMDTCVQRGMVAIMSFHFDQDNKTGEEKPHCHVLLSTRHLTETGFGLKNREWDRVELVEEWREQCAQYQNAALKEHGHEVRVDHRSYADQGLEIDPQPKRGMSIIEMTNRGFETDKGVLFDFVRLKNQFRILKNPEIVFSIVTAKHSTFTRTDIAKVLHRYIDDAEQFRHLLDRLMASKELVDLETSSFHTEGREPAYTTKEMLRTELNLVRQAETLSAQKTHPVGQETIEKVIANHNQKLEQYGGLSPDQDHAIRHLFASDQISCVIGFAGAGKTTSLEAAKEGWEEAGYKVLGLAPTGKAARNMEECGIRSMTLHKFLHAQQGGREQTSSKTVVVVDEAGMIDSRRFLELLSLVDTTGAKIVLMGDGNQLQAVEAGPAFRLLSERVKPAVLETVVRQQVDWQRDATRLFGNLQTRQAVALYQEKGCIQIIPETKPSLDDKNHLVENYCLARQVSGRLWKEMLDNLKEDFSSKTFNPETDFDLVVNHRDYKLFQQWKDLRKDLVEDIIQDFNAQKATLAAKGVDIEAFGDLVAAYQGNGENKGHIWEQIEGTLRAMSYAHRADTRIATKQALVEAWAQDRQALPNQSHLMLAFTNKDATSLNELARALMREQGEIKGRDYSFTTQRLDTDDFGNEVKTPHTREFAEGDRILFTRNDNRLGVKNGTLGTIQSLDQNKIAVALDMEGKQGDGKKIVSFSPNLYPFIDHGWATTIHKAQGTTVDHVKLLASYEQYRNLTYVGMSRHRHSLQVFASDLDFWREDKMFHRLSRVQEKLSGFDYMDAKKLEEQMKEDTSILWHERTIQQGKDLWAAVKFTAQDVLRLSTSPLKEDTTSTFHSFNNSEEIRSVDIFKAPALEPPNVNAQDKRHSPQEAKVWGYLQQEINFEKHPWLKESHAQRLLEAAAQNPIETLGRWQQISGDYSFNPLQQSEFAPQGQQATRDINEEDTHLDKAVKEFIALSKAYEKLPWREFEKKEDMSKKLDNMAEAYWKDEQFVQKVEMSKNKAAIERINDEIRTQQRALSRGMDFGL